MSSVYSTANVVIPDDAPTPTGYHILVVVPKVEEQTKGGIILPSDIKDKEDIASIVAKVVTLGNNCYPNEDNRFRGKAWCKVGDWVVLSKYVGHRFEYDGVEMRIINDDSVLAVIKDPTKISRANT